jgi:hypothetical protein
MGPLVSGGIAGIDRTDWAKDTDKQMRRDGKCYETGRMESRSCLVRSLLECTADYLSTEPGELIRIRESVRPARECNLIKTWRGTPSRQLNIISALLTPTSRNVIYIQNAKETSSG